MKRLSAATLVLAATLLATGCVSLDYDLSSIPAEVSAKPGDGEAFRIETKNVLWLHGLFGHEQPDVAALLAERTAGAERITDFRVRQTSNIHQWLLTHLSLTLVRMRTVVIEGKVAPAG